MTSTWFTADHHFHHTKILAYCNRPFGSVEEMNEVMIERWNEKTRPKDTVYHLGDFTLGGKEAFQNIAKKLNGLIRIIPGNHDARWLNKKWIANVIIEPLISVMKYNKNIIVMSHYAMRVWNRSHHGSIHLYGHSHGNLPSYGKSLDVGVDCNNFYPYHIDEIMSMMSKKEISNDEPKNIKARK